MRKAEAFRNRLLICSGPYRGRVHLYRGAVGRKGRQLAQALQHSAQHQQEPRALTRLGTIRLVNFRVCRAGMRGNSGQERTQISGIVKYLKIECLTTNTVTIDGVGGSLRPTGLPGMFE